MSELHVNADAKIIKVLADQVRGKRVDSNAVKEANEICQQLAMGGKSGMEEIAQTVAYTVNDLQMGALDFVETIADSRTCNYNEKVAFNMPTGGIKAVIQAKGATTPRSEVGSRQLFIETMEVSARPAINIMELRCGRINMADLIRQANEQMTLVKTGHIEKVLHQAVQNFATPFYGSGNGIDTTVLDEQIMYLRRLGPVAIIGDIAAVSQLVGVQGMVGAYGTGTIKYSDNQVDYFMDNGYLGRYKGCDVIAMPNAYEVGKTTPVLQTNWLYLMNTNLSKDLRNLKVLTEGSVQSFESQDINDLVYEVRLDQWFGAAFVTNKIPTIAAYNIN